MSHGIGMLVTLLALCEGYPQVTGGFPRKGRVTQSFGVLVVVCLNKLLDKQPRRQI